MATYAKIERETDREVVKFSSWSAKYSLNGAGMFGWEQDIFSLVLYYSNLIGNALCGQLGFEFEHCGATKPTSWR